MSLKIKRLTLLQHFPGSNELMIEEVVLKFIVCNSAAIISIEAMEKKKDILTMWSEKNFGVVFHLRGFLDIISSSQQHGYLQ